MIRSCRNNTALTDLLRAALASGGFAPGGLGIGGTRERAPSWNPSAGTVGELNTPWEGMERRSPIYLT